MELPQVGTGINYIKRVNMTKQIRVLVDMDGVLVDFGKQYKLINGVYPDEVYVPGGPRTPEKDRLWNQYVDKEGFVDAPIHAGAIELIQELSVLLALNKIGVIEICTSAGGKERQVDVTRQKKSWLKSQDLDDLTAHIVQNGHKKADVIDKEKYHDILIDDTEMVVANFISHGGYGIMHTSTPETIKQLHSLIESLS